MTKINRKKLKQDDEFITFSQQAIAWSKEHARTLSVVVGSVLVAVVVVVVWQSYVANRDADAARALAKAFAPYAQAVENHAVKGKPASAEADLRRVAEQYGAAPAGQQGRLALAGLLMQQSRFKQAAEQFNILSQERSLPRDLQPLVWHGLGQAQEALKDYGQAVASYQKSIELAGPSQAAAFRLDKARALEAGGKTAEAKAVYEQFLKQNPAGPGATVAKSRLVAMGVDVNGLLSPGQ